MRKRSTASRYLSAYRSRILSYPEDLFLEFFPGTPAIAAGESPKRDFRQMTGSDAAE